MTTGYTRPTLSELRTQALAYFRAQGFDSGLKKSVIVMVSTGDIGEDARRYANKIMQDSNLCVVMIDHVDLDAIKTNPAHIVDAFKREAHNAMTLKQIDL